MKNNSKCAKYNFNKIIQNPEQYNSNTNNITPQNIIEYTNIPCSQYLPNDGSFAKSKSKIIQNINIDNQYKMASINKDALITEINNIAYISPDKKYELINRINNPNTNLIDIFEQIFGSYYFKIDFTIDEKKNNDEEKKNILFKELKIDQITNKMKNILKIANIYDSIIFFLKNNYIGVCIVLFLIFLFLLKKYYSNN